MGREMDGAALFALAIGAIALFYLLVFAVCRHVKK